MAHINAEEGGRVYFYPFCSNGFFDLAQECVGCSFAKTAGLAIERNGSLYFPFNGSLCNPSVTEFPLPLYKCSICNRRLLNAALAYIIVVSLLTILGNGWSILVWIRIQKRPQVLFKLSLAISDFLFGAILLPFAAVDLGKTMYAPNMEYYSFSTYTGGIGSRDDYERNWEALFSPFHHHFAALILYVSQGASLCSVMLLNIDRHIAITRNINYQRIMTKSKSIAIVIGMWVVVAVLGFVTTFACGTYITQPFALFLPIVEPGNDMQELFKILCIYLLPISLVFFGNCVVAVYTSIKIYKLSKAEERPFFVSSRRSTMNQLKTSSLFKYLMEKSGRKTNNNNLSPHDYSGNLTQEKTVNNDSLKVPNLEIVVPPLDSKVVNPKSHNFSAPVVTADIIEEQNQQGENEKSNLSKQSSSFSAVTVSIYHVFRLFNERACPKENWKKFKGGGRAGGRTVDLEGPNVYQWGGGTKFEI